MFKLDGKVAIITGGSRGIGAACAEAMAEQGAHVVVNYVRGEDKAREVAERIIAKGGKAEIAGFDVADSEATEKAIEGIAKKHGRLDIMVANAGIAIDGLLLRLKDEDLQKLFDTNVRGALACARAATRPMMKARTGRIIFVSSVIGEMGNVGQTAYAATKAALLGITKSIAREYASRNVTVNAIAPGFIETDMTHGMNDAMKEYVLKNIPLARVGTAKEVAAAALYLASDEAAYVTGQVLRVNGGMYV
ncbi:MAG: 3-oxoacyl-ACP reductase FabG [Polyangiaceae bacterium]|nr:3-oxoacyl-ACP reductase FabG [Polyangiaceae bacterium]